MPFLKKLNFKNKDIVLGDAKQLNGFGQGSHMHFGKFTLVTTDALVWDGRIQEWK